MKFNWVIVIVVMALTLVKDSGDKFTRNKDYNEKTIVTDLSESINIELELISVYFNQLKGHRNRLNEKTYSNIIDVTSKPLKWNYAEIKILYMNGVVNLIYEVNNCVNLTKLECFQANNQFRITYYCNLNNFINTFSIGSSTKYLNENTSAISNHYFYSILNIIDNLCVFKCHLDDYRLRINWLYLGKNLTRNKYSINVSVTSVKSQKHSVLILILLFMCGDTGASINPDPACVNDLVDPDINHFSANIEFETHSIETF